MRKLIPLVVLALVCASAPANAVVEPQYYSGASTFFEIGQHEGAPKEVWFFGGSGRVLLNSWSQDPVHPVDSGGCISVFYDGLFEEACGEFDVLGDPSLTITTIQGEIDSIVYEYDFDTGFTPIGNGTITLDVTLTGDGLPRLAHSENTGIGSCGLPPDVKGVFAFGEAPIVRDATLSGTIEGSAVGAIDMTTLWSRVGNSTYVEAGACLS